MICRCAAPHEYIRTWDEFRFLPGVQEAVRLLNKGGYRVVVVSNQRGIARGLLTVQDVTLLHEKMQEALQEQGVYIDAIYICPHEAGTCNCRKPEIGLFLRAEREHSVDKSTSWKGLWRQNGFDRTGQLWTRHDVR